MRNAVDVIVAGTGPGGGTLAYALRGSGARVLMLERGDFIPQEPQNWDRTAVLVRHRYKDLGKHWINAGGQALMSMAFHAVGGQSKFYGGALLRMRKGDFEGREQEDGPVSAWPISYQDLEPYYAQAERIYWVHGAAGEDPTEPSRSGPFPFPPIPHEAETEQLMGAFRHHGWMPFHLPIGIDRRPGGRCIVCPTCDGFPCQIHAKADTEVCCVRPALEDPNIELLTGAQAYRLRTDAGGRRVVAIEVLRNGQSFEHEADVFVIACGVYESPALLMRSANDRHPGGIGNGSDTVGRNLMFKQMTMLTAIHSEVPHTGTFHKTWGVHDFYAPRGSSKAYGVVQSSGKLFPARSPNEPPDAATQAAFAARGMNLLLMTPSRAERENRIRIAPDGRIQVMFGPEQRGTAHAELVDAVKQTLVKVGYGEVFGVTRPYDNKVRWLWPGTHVAGSLRMGSNPADSVVDAACRVHGLDNLYVVDASVFPSQPAVNPALTIAANALRVADGIMGRHAPARP